MNAVQNSVPSLSISDGGGKLTEVVEVEIEGVELAPGDVDVVNDVVTGAEVCGEAVLVDVAGVAVGLAVVTAGGD